MGRLIFKGQVDDFDEQLLVPFKLYLKVSIDKDGRFIETKKIIPLIR